MRLPTLLSLAATALLASANPQAIPNVGSIVSTALDTAPVPAGIAPVFASAVAAVEAIPNNANSNLIAGLNVPPTELFNNILAVISILDVVLALLGFSEFTDPNAQNITIGGVEIPIPRLSGFGSSSSSGLNIGTTITTLIALIAPLLSTASA